MADAKQKPGQSTVKRRRMRLTERQAIKIASEVVCSLSTVHRWARGDEVLANTDERIRKAIEKLNIRESTV